MPLRPTTPWEKRTDFRQTILFDEATWRALHTWATDKDMSLSAVVRAGVRTLIKQQEAAEGHQ